MRALFAKYLHLTGVLVARRVLFVESAGDLTASPGPLGFNPTTYQRQKNTVSISGLSFSANENAELITFLVLPVYRSQLHRSSCASTAYKIVGWYPVAQGICIFHCSQVRSTRSPTTMLLSECYTRTLSRTCVLIV